MKEAKRFYDSGHGILTEVSSEKEVLDITTYDFFSPFFSLLSSNITRCSQNNQVHGSPFLSSFVQTM